MSTVSMKIKNILANLSPHMVTKLPNCFAVKLPVGEMTI